MIVVIPLIGGTAPRLACGYCAVPSAPGVGVGEALSAAASGNCETDGTTESAGVTGGNAEVFDVASDDPAGGGVALRVNSGSVAPERSGSVTPGGSCGLRMVPGDEAVAGFTGRIGPCGFLGASVFPAAPFLSSSAFLRALNWARRWASSFSWASRSAAICCCTSCLIMALISSSVVCFWQEQNAARAMISGRAKKFFMSG